MPVIRLSKIAFVAAIAFFATLVVIENVFHPSINFPFVEHVMMMDTIFPDAPLGYRAINNPIIHWAGYVIIVAGEILTAVLCWMGAAAMWCQRKADARAFHLSKRLAIWGLAIGFLVWHVAFMSVGGEWFGMWMSQQWNGIPSAYRFFITILVVLIYVVMPDYDADDLGMKK